MLLILSRCAKADDASQHTSLLDRGEHDIAPSRFLVVAHPDWEDQGVLLVDLDCDLYNEGISGVIRVDVGFLPHWLMLLESSKASFSDLKTSELDTQWTDEILGYSGSKLQRVGCSCVGQDSDCGKTMLSCDNYQGLTGEKSTLIDHGLSLYRNRSDRVESTVRSA